VLNVSGQPSSGGIQLVIAGVVVTAPRITEKSSDGKDLPKPAFRERENAALAASVDAGLKL